MLYEIKFYDCDHGGMHTELTSEEYFDGSREEVEAHVKSKDSPWGYKYRVTKQSRPGAGVIRQINPEEKVVKEQIDRLSVRLRELRR